MDTFMHLLMAQPPLSSHHDIHKRLRNGGVSTGDLERLYGTLEKLMPAFSQACLSLMKGVCSAPLSISACAGCHSMYEQAYRGSNPTETTDDVDMHRCIIFMDVLRHALLKTDKARSIRRLLELGVYENILALHGAIAASMLSTENQTEILPRHQLCCVIEGLITAVMLSRPTKRAPRMFRQSFSLGITGMLEWCSEKLVCGENVAMILETRRLVHLLPILFLLQQDETLEFDEISELLSRLCSCLIWMTDNNETLTRASRHILRTVDPDMPTFGIMSHHAEEAGDDWTLQALMYVIELMYVFSMRDGIGRADKASIFEKTYHDAFVRVFSPLKDADVYLGVVEWLACGREIPNWNGGVLSRNPIFHRRTCFAEGCTKTTRDNGKALSLCTGCRKVYYCSRKCQKVNWKKHKVNCRK